MTALSRSVAVGLFGAAVVIACGSSGESEFKDGSSGSSGASSGASSSGDFGGSSGASGSGGDASANDSGESSDADLNADTACAQSNAQATLKPLDMFIMFDRSISMGPGDCNVGGNTASPWCYAINALATYLKGTSSTGNAAALQFFGQGGGPASANTCTTGAGFNVSAVPGGATGYTDLPSATFDTALNAAGPDQYTPLEPAIRGITGFTGTAANQRAGRTTIGILITDASTPLDCSTDITAMATLLSTHATNTGVKTFVVGMNGANFTNLETLAVAGGGPQHNDVVGAATDACGNGAGPCRHWNAGDGTSGAPLVEALKQIQGLAVGCTFTIPPPSGGGTIDFNQVKVEYLPNGATPSQQLAKVNDAAACSGAGWYYDNNTTPTSVSLCPTSCTTVQGDANAKLNVLFGCVKPSSSSSSTSGGVN